ncbi:hypothetical protein D3C72_1202800 [compost metagenome]
MSSTTCDCSRVALAIEAFSSVTLRSAPSTWCRLSAVWWACSTVCRAAWLLALMTSTAASELPCRRSIMSWICAVDCWVRWASRRTSSATTAKPRPCSPARAASMAAFSASRLVCSAMARITSSTLPIWVLSRARLWITSTAWPMVSDNWSIWSRLMSMLCWPRRACSSAWRTSLAACSAFFATSCTA